MNPYIVTTVHDPGEVLLDFVNQIDISVLKKYFSCAAVTEDTSEATLKYLRDQGFETIVGGLYGESRTTSIRFALEAGAETIFSCEFDKLYSWYQNHPSSLLDFIQLEHQEQLVVVGRTEQAWQTYPESWVQTEQIANKMLSRMVGKDIDPYTGPVLLKKEAAQTIVDNATEKVWGSIADYVLICLDHNIEIGSFNTDGMEWENPYVYAHEVKSMGEDTWREKYYNSVNEWEKRTASLLEQLRVIKRHESKGR